MHTEKRKRIWIDGFQTRLFFRIAGYFILYQLAVCSMVGIYQVSYQPLESALGQAVAFYFLGFGLVLLLIMGALFIYDAIKFAHRIVGPLYRFRKAVQAIRDEKEAEFLRLRQGDFLQELKDDFNAMLQVLEERGAVEIKGCPGKKEQHKPVTV